ncbi:MAG: sigma-70 family RNA polymerase sigma factor [Myxococcales bacterium]|nr:sigma-70 family RNA polymerase sigma factor [Myxococcales bacterium]MCB9751226.1 sigma-70 family RNA polymerase sigma factor [Myxococcales bacterium]
MDDVAYLHAWRDGDRDAGAALFERYYDLVTRFFRNKAGEEASDLVQETFLRMVRTQDRMRDGTTFRCYLFGVARMVLLEHYRAKRLNRERIDFMHVTAADLGLTPTSALARAREEQLLLEALRSIPVEMQIVLELYYWENMSGREIAEIIGIPEGTARTRLRRARHRLEDRLKRLARSPLELKSTVTRLDSWAEGLRARLGKEDFA